MTSETPSPRADTCMLLSVSAAVICWIPILVYIVKFLGGWLAGAGHGLSEDGLEFGILAVMMMLPLTVAGIVLAAFAKGHRKVALGAQGITIVLVAGILLLFNFLTR